MIFLAVGDGPDRLAHAVLHNHAADDLRRLLYVARCARTDLAEHDLLGDASAECDLDAVNQFRTRAVGTILLRQGAYSRPRAHAE